jgi:thymidylate synthase
MWLDLLRLLLERPDYRDSESRLGGMAGEIVGYDGELDASKQQTLVTCPAREVSPAYAAAEVLWTLSGSSDGRAMLPYAPKFVERYCHDDDGYAYWAYGERIMAGWEVSENPDSRSQLERAIDLLKRDPTSRQAVVSIWQPHDLSVAEHEPSMQKEKVVPCSQLFQLLLREGRLHMLTYTRSNDVWLGMPYDVFTFTCLQRVVAAHLGCGVGLYRHMVGSAHLYERYVEDAREAVAAKSWATRSESHGWLLDDTLDSMCLAVELERGMRERGQLDLQRLDACGSMGRDLMLACAEKLFRGRIEEKPKSPRLKTATD